jgi:hypothetical protein
MNRFRKVAESLMSHSRDIRMSLYQDKIVYDIPKYMVCEKFLYSPQINIKDHSIEVHFMLKEPTSHHLEASSYGMSSYGLEKTVGNEKSFQ